MSPKSFNTQDGFLSKDRSRISATSTANNYEGLISTSKSSVIAPPLTPGDSGLLWGENKAPTAISGRIELPPEESMKQSMLKTAYAECERITSAYAKTFYLGTSFLDMDKRSATWAIYVWCRRTDDIVDSPRAILENTMEADLAEVSGEEEEEDDDHNDYLLLTAT